MINSPLIYASKISQYYKKKIWLKLEILNPTGSHKDRESILLINEAKKNNFKSIGCASTGNLGISIAFYSKIYKFKSNIWLRKQDINEDNLNLIKLLGAKVHIKKISNLSKLYDFSSELMKKNKIFNANPNNSEFKILANTQIVKEIYNRMKKFGVNTEGYVIDNENTKDKFLQLIENFLSKLNKTDNIDKKKDIMDNIENLSNYDSIGTKISKLLNN